MRKTLHLLCTLGTFVFVVSAKALNDFCINGDSILVFVSHNINSTMKTVILLCSLATFATAIPTLIKGTFNELEGTIREPSANIKREKKSPLHDSIHEDIPDHEKEISPSNTGLKSHIVGPAFEGRSLGFKKPLIIKKKFGYHLYRDSDEEMAYADPHEHCRKQVKVKLCDDEPSIYSNKLSKNTKSAGLDITGNEVEHSIKMAKEAVENLQRNIQKMEESSMKLRENSKNVNLATDAEVQDDIETARKALEHVTQNFETLESMESPKSEDSLMPKSSTDEEKLAQWKEAIENIHKNFEIARNIEDAFRFESLNSYSSENDATVKLLDSEMSKVGEYEIQQKSNDERLDDSKNELKNDKNTYEQEKFESLHDSPAGKSNSLEEKQIENDDDIFTSSSNNKEFKIELHSDSLRQEKTATDLIEDNMEKGELMSDESKMLNLDEELPKLKNAEDTSEDQPHILSALNTPPSSAKSALLSAFEELEKQASAEIENKEISNLAKEADIENINISENIDHKSIPKSSEGTSDFQTQEEIKEIFDIKKPNSDSIEELFMPKEATNTDKMLTEPTNTDIHYLQEKNADEQQKDENHLALLLDRENPNEIKMRETLDIPILQKESKMHNNEEDIRDASDEKMTSDNSFTNENINSAQRITSEDMDEPFNLRSVQEKHAIIEQASSITPINSNKQQTTNELLSNSMTDHDSMSRAMTEGANILRSVQESGNKDDSIPTIKKSFSAQKEHKHEKTNEEQDIINENNNLHSLRFTQENNFETKNQNLKHQQNLMNEQINLRMAEDHKKGESLSGIQTLNNLPNLDLLKGFDDIDPKFKTVAANEDKESPIPTKNNPNQQVNAHNGLFNLQTMGDLGMEHESAKNADPREFNFMHFFPKEQSDTLPQEFKSASTFHNDKNPLTATNNNELDINQRLFNGKQGVRMTEDSNIEDFLSQNRNLQIAPVSRWSEDRQRMSLTSPGFKSATSLPNENSLLTTSKGPEHYNEDQMIKEKTNMRMNEGRYTGQQYNYNNNQQMYDMQSMAWLEDKQHKHLAQQYSHVPEYNNNHFRPYLQQHGYTHMNRHNQFKLDNNHDPLPLSSRNHDNVHLMRDSKISEIDSSMQPSSQMNMRDNGQQWGHHRSMSRTAFGGLPIAGVSPGTVGVFPTANTGCGIPLMLSCSPSVVSGSLAKAHPTIPAYRSDDDIMFYTKRDAKNVDHTPVKIQRTPFNHKSDLILNKQ